MLQVAVRTTSSGSARAHSTLSRASAWLIAGLLVGSALALGPAVAEAQDSQTPAAGSVEPLAPPQVVSLDLEAPADPVRPGGRARAVLKMTIEHGWHVNANQPLEDFLIATEVALGETPAELVAAVYPKPEVVELSFSEEPMAVYEGSVLIGLELKTPDGVAEGGLTVPGVVTVQACNDAMCMPPTDLPFEIGLQVSVGGIDLAASPLAARVIWTDAAGQAKAPGASEAAGRTGGTGGFDSSRGLLLTFLLVFAGGLALNLTPCVYPMIPITISIFGAQSGGPRQSLKLAAFYVLGMALTYSALGTVAALTGSLLGSALQNPLVLVFIAAVMVVLALSMFGLYDIAVPQRLSRVASGNRQGSVGALFMGATVGIIAAPCIGPFVLGLLTYVGTTGNPALGFSLFFTLALGLGVPFLVLAIASGSLAALPRSGSWMIWVKKVFGFVLLGMALYFLSRSPRLVPERLFLPGLAILSLAAALVLAVLDHTRSPGRGFRMVKRATGLTGILMSAGFLIAPRFLVPTTGITWSDYTEEAITAAAGAGLPVIIDFTADWCIPCKELDHWTFAAAPVVERARSFVTLKADLSDSRSPAVRTLRDRYRVLGVPTVVFLAPNGSEISDLRITGVIPPKEFLARMDQAR